MSGRLTQIAKPRIIHRLRSLASIVGTNWALASGVVVCAIVTSFGCVETQPSIAPEVLATHQGRLLLTEEPAGAQAVLDVREIFTGPSEDVVDHHSAGMDHDTPESTEQDEEIEFTTEDVAEDENSEVNMVAVDEPQQVVVVGKLGGMPNPWSDNEPQFPFKDNQATVFLVDPATAAEFEDSEHSHEHLDDCPFCARAAAENVNAIAVVNFVDEAGQTVPFAAKPLLELSELDTVVVRGTARMVGGEMLVIDADGIYVRK